MKILNGNVLVDGRFVKTDIDISGGKITGFGTPAVPRSVNPEPSDMDTYP